MSLRFSGARANRRPADELSNILRDDWIEKYTQGKSDRWLAVDEMRLVRNCIAHANGLVAEAANLDELRRILTLKKGAYEDEFGFVAIEKQFCDAA